MRDDRTQTPKVKPLKPGPPVPKNPLTDKRNPRFSAAKLKQIAQNGPKSAVSPGKTEKNVNNEGKKLPMKENRSNVKENKSNAKENVTNAKEHKTNAKENEKNAKEIKSSAKENETNTKENVANKGSRPVHMTRGLKPEEVEKKRQIQDEVDSEIDRFRQETLRRLDEKAREKKENALMLRDFDPWGRPGGGAPLTSYGGDKRRKQPSARPEIQPDSSRSFMSGFGSPGGGAPLVDERGRIITDVKVDPNLRFQDSPIGRRLNEKEIRYRKSKSEQLEYGRNLDLQIQHKQVSKQQERIGRLRRELQMLEEADPYGRPGSGAPNNYDGRTIRNSRRIITNASQPPQSNDADVFDPWGKGAGNARRTENGRVVAHRSSGMQGLHDSLNRRINKSSLTAKITDANSSFYNSYEQGGTVARRAHSQPPEVKPPEAELLYDPWGKSGCGAPIRREDGSIRTSFPGRLQGQSPVTTIQKLNARKVLSENLDEGMHEHEFVKNQVAQHVNLGNVLELDELVTRGKVGKPLRSAATGLIAPSPRTVTDVTNPKAFQKFGFVGANKQRDELLKNELLKNELLKSELQKQAEERQLRKRIDRKYDIQEDVRHESTMNSFWGRDGAGAANAVTHRLGNTPAAGNTPDDYFVMRNAGRMTPRVPEARIVAAHARRYDLRAPRPSKPQDNYHVRAPWATFVEE